MSKAIPKLSRDQFEAQMEWLFGPASWELAARPTVEQLEEISRVAKRCAKHLRELDEAK